MIKYRVKFIFNYYDCRGYRFDAVYETEIAYRNPNYYNTKHMIAMYNT